MRTLAIMGIPPTPLHDEAEIPGLEWRQLVVDLCYEALAADESRSRKLAFVDRLTQLTDKVETSLTEFLGAIRENNKTAAFAFLRSYTTECDQYERTASIALIHYPHSSAIREHVGRYFKRLRGNEEKGQTWLDACDRSRSSSMLFSSRSRFSSTFFGKASSAQFEADIAQRAAAQTAITGIESVVFPVGSLLACCGLLVLLVAAFYNPAYGRVDCLTSATVARAEAAAATFGIPPFFAMFDFMGRGLQQCAPDRAADFDSLFASFVVPFASPQDTLKDSLLRIPDALAVIDERYLDELGAFEQYSWGSLNVGNSSLELLLNQVRVVISLLPEGNCSEAGLAFLNESLSLVLSIHDPLVKLEDIFGQCEDLSLDDFSRAFWLYFGLMSLALAVVLGFVLFVLVWRADSERRMFWDELVDIDDPTAAHFSRAIQPERHQIRANPSRLTEDSVLNLEPFSLESEEPPPTLAVASPRRGGPYLFPVVCAVFFAVFAGSLLAFRYPLVAVYRIRMAVHQVRDEFQAVITEQILSFMQPCLHLWIHIIDATFETCPIVGLTFAPPDLDELLKTHPSYFKRAAEFARTFETLKGQLTTILASWDDTALTDNFFAAARLSFRDLTSLCMEVAAWANDSNRRLARWETAADHSFRTLFGVLFVVFAAGAARFLSEYEHEFESLKSIAGILASVSWAGIGAIVARFRSQKRKHVDQNSSVTRYLVKHSVHPVLLINADLKIQDANNASLMLFKFKQDDLIGFALSGLFVEDAQSASFYTQISFYLDQVRNQGAPQVGHRDFPLRAKPSDGEEVPVTTTLIPLFDPALAQQLTFALRLIDTSEFMQQKDDTEIMKGQTENLLEKIMPHIMVTKMRANTEDLTWQVNPGTFLFIGIAKFLDWCKLHSHIQIMQLLDNIVTTFDAKIEKYQSLDKIKIINGVYMAAGGLFEKRPETQLEMVEFAIECLKWMDAQNSMTEMKFALQIGIHTGGPIIAGIVGRDRPFFDVYGDAVNMAARLETSAPDNSIQISHEMVAALPPGRFTFAEREHVPLKGKGEVNTYVIGLQSLRDQHSQVSVAKKELPELWPG
jgi:PAS domain-containing protein